MSDDVIGTCSCCGGGVVVLRVWAGVGWPRPTCSRCGASRALPVIEMAPPPRKSPAPGRLADIVRQLGGEPDAPKAGEP